MMTRKISKLRLGKVGFFVALSITSALAIQNPAASDEALVGQFFPQRLIDDSEAEASVGGPDPFRHASFLTAELNGPGNGQFIIAAYTNGFLGAVRILRKQNGSAILISEPNLPLMSGIFSSIYLLDIDNDNKAEVEVGFSSATGNSANWLFRWTGTDLISVGPTTITSEGETSTNLHGPVFVDLNGDGILEAVNSVETDSPDAVTRIFRFQNGSYKPWKSVNFYSQYFRHTGRPETVENTFSVAETQRLYTLTIVNGDREGKNRVSSAEIRLNGSVVAGPDRFNQQVREIVIPVSLVSTNIVAAQLQGAPGGQLIITIEPRD